MNYIVSIIDELNKENGTNYKMSVLKKYQNDILLKKVLKMTYDTVDYTYGITMKNVKYNHKNVTLEFCDALEMLSDKFATRKVTGNAAIKLLSDTLSNLTKDDALLVEKIIGRDLKINLGKTQINKVFKGLITKPVYMRCDVYSKKTSKNINYPSIVQLKADGLAMFVRVEENAVICNTRSGVEFQLDSLQTLKDNAELLGYTIQGEFLIENETDRAKSNGLINSLIKYKNGENKTLTAHEAKEIENKIVFQIWDIISEEDVVKAKNKDKTGTPYKERWDKLKGLFGDR